MTVSEDNSKKILGLNGYSGQVGEWFIRWVKPPRGNSGMANVEIRKGNTGNFETCTVQWVRTTSGLQIEVLSKKEKINSAAHRVSPADKVQDLGPTEFYLERLRTDSGLTEWRIEGNGIHWEGLEWQTERSRSLSLVKKSAASAEVKVRAQMPGKVVRILCELGVSVEKGAGLLVLEAMKMENEIRSPISGIVKTISVQAGQAVEAGAELMRMGASNE